MPVVTLLVHNGIEAAVLGLSRRRLLLDCLSLVPKAYCSGKSLWMLWYPPMNSGFQLHVDGSSKQGECSGGSLIRKHHGSVILSFSLFFGNGSNNVGEARALLEGLKLWLLYNISLTEVECDYDLIVKCSLSSAAVPWRIAYYVREIQSFLSPQVKLSHTLLLKPELARSFFKVAVMLIFLSISLSPILWWLSLSVFLCAICSFFTPPRRSQASFRPGGRLPCLFSDISPLFLFLSPL